jgi:hypothetical protein
LSVGIRGRSVELYVRFVDAIGNPANTDETPQVEVFDSTGIRRQPFTNVGVSLIEDNQPGLYKFDYSIPETAPDGYWSVTWRANIGNETVTSTFDFLVIADGGVQESSEPVYIPGDDSPWDFSKDENNGINRLLRMVKCRVKNDGVRKVPDGDGGYMEIPCSVFTDTELVCFLVNSLSSFNQMPHFTNLTFAEPMIYTTFADIIVQGAVVLALAAQSLIEKGREFNFNDNGVTYQPPQVADILNTQYSTQLNDYKEKLKYIKNQFKSGPLGLGTFRCTAINPAFLRLRHLRERRLI